MGTRTVATKSLGLKALMSAAEAAGYAMATYSMAADEPDERPESVFLALPAPQGSVPAPYHLELEHSFSAQALVWGASLREWLFDHFPGRAAA
jgi:hypothetical protein